MISVSWVLAWEGEKDFLARGERLVRWSNTTTKIVQNAAQTSSHPAVAIDNAGRRLGGRRKD